MMIKVTSKQNEYLRHLESGPKTKKDLMGIMGVTTDTAGMMIKKLKDAGLVTSDRIGTGNALEHKLIMPYFEMAQNGLVVRDNKTGTAIPEEEIYHAAILRNENLTGQRFINRYLKKFPNRPPKTIGNIVAMARRRRLCR